MSIYILIYSKSNMSCAAFRWMSVCILVCIGKKLNGDENENHQLNWCRIRWRDRNYIIVCHFMNVCDVCIIISVSKVRILTHIQMSPIESSFSFRLSFDSFDLMMLLLLLLLFFFTLGGIFSYFEWSEFNLHAKRTNR